MKRTSTLRPALFTLLFMTLTSPSFAAPKTDHIEQKPLIFKVSHELSLIEAVTEIRAGLHTSTGKPSIIFLELPKHGADAKQYTLDTTYLDLKSLAAKMRTQDAHITWEVIDDALFIYPATGSTLNHLVSYPTGSQ